MAGSAASSYQRKQTQEAKKLVVCASCDAEFPKGARCCGNCGSRSLIPKLDYLKQVQEAKVAKYRYGAEQARKMDEFRKVKADLQTARHMTTCTSCDEVFPPGTVYCTHCGHQTVVVNEASARAAVRQHHSKLNLSDDDVSRLDAMQIEPEPTLTGIGVGVAKSAIKGTAKLFWRGTKTVMREVAK